MRSSPDRTIDESARKLAEDDKPSLQGVTLCRLRLRKGFRPVILLFPVARHLATPSELPLGRRPYSAADTAFTQQRHEQSAPAPAKRYEHFQIVWNFPILGFGTA